ncbi:MAG: hypothetical protein MI892_28335 [Desulfobacterales bacterium]|nr:hypothetical protein [Desulfobacterales bacterium]
MNSISMKCLFESESFIYDSQNDTLTERRFFKLFETGTKKIFYSHRYQQKPEVVVMRKSPDAHLVVVEEIYSDHAVLRKTDAGDFTGDDYEWIVTGRPLYPPKK